MNTSKYIPVESVTPIVLETPDWSFFGGTGFFAYLPPFDEVFFVTARHCVTSPDGGPLGVLKIPYHPQQGHNEAVQFSEYLETEYVDDRGEREDVAVYVVADVPAQRLATLRARALRLPNQELAEVLLEQCIHTQGRLRTVGFPSEYKEIDYDANQATVQPRGFHGIPKGTGMRNRYKLENINWKDGKTNGFSGSPVLALCPNVGGQIQAVPLGVLVTGSSEQVSFLFINIATELIASYVKRKYRLEGHRDDLVSVADEPVER